MNPYPRLNIKGHNQAGMISHIPSQYYTATSTAYNWRLIFWNVKPCKQTKNSVAFSAQANYTDSATATSWKILVPTFADRGVSSGQRGSSPRPLISVF
jgi:hypothetical protein